MVLAYENSGAFAQAVYGNSTSQHAGPNGSIAMNHVGSGGAEVKMAGGRNQSKKRNQNKKRTQSKKRNQSKKRRSQRQRGGK